MSFVTKFLLSHLTFIGGLMVAVGAAVQSYLEIEKHSGKHRTKPLKLFLWGLIAVGTGLALFGSNYDAEQLSGTQKQVIDAQKQLSEAQNKQVEKENEIRQVLEPVGYLAVRVTMRLPDGKEEESEREIDREGTKFLPITDIRTKGNINYRFMGIAQENGGVETVVRAWDQDDARRQSTQPVYEGGELMRAPKDSEHSYLLFRFDTNSMAVSHGMTLATLQHAHVEIHYSYVDNIPRFDPRNIVRVEVLSNPGGGEFRLSCFDVVPDNWHQSAELGTLDLAYLSGEVSVDTPAACKTPLR